MDKSEYVLPSSEAESERLELQAQLYGGVGYLEHFLAAAPARVLEVGCGTGYAVRHLARTLSGSRVCGVDIDRGRLEVARRAAADLPNAAFLPGRVEALPFAADMFDLVYCRFVLVHAVDPTVDLAEMIRVTRPGGVVVAYDMVHSGVWFSPPRPAFAALLGAVCDVMRERGMEPDQGLHLGPALARAGLRDVSAEPLSFLMLSGDPLFEVYRRNWLQTVDGLEDILAHGFGRKRIDAALAELRDPVEHQSLLETTVLAWGTKP